MVATLAAPKLRKRKANPSRSACSPERLDVSLQIKVFLGGGDKEVRAVEAVNASTGLDFHFQRLLKRLERRKEGRQVLGSDARRLHPERKVHFPHKVLEGAQAIVAKPDGVCLEGTVRQVDFKVLDAHAFVIAYDLQAELVQVEAGVGLDDAEALDGSIDGVVAQGLQGDAGYDVVQGNVLGVELARSLFFRKHVVGQPPPADEQGVDAQVQVRLLRFFLTGLESVHDELEVRGTFRCVLAQADVESEELYVADGDLSFQQGQEVELGRQAGHFQHVPAGEVVHFQVVDDDAVEEAEVDSSDAQFASQGGTQLPGNKHGHPLLDVWQVQQKDGTDIYSQCDADEDAYGSFQSFDKA